MITRDSSRILLVGESQGAMQSAIAAAAPRSQIVTASTVFDAIAELSLAEFQAVFCPTEPIERRPESAVATLRNVAGDAKLILFGHPTLEPLSRKMLSFGCDDYLITPAEPTEISELLEKEKDKGPAGKGQEQDYSHANLHPSSYVDDDDKASSGPSRAGQRGNTANEDNSAFSVQSSALSANHSSLLNFDSTIFLDALLNHSTDASSSAVAQLNHSLSPLRVALLDKHKSPPPAADGFVAFSQAIDRNRADSPMLYIQAPRSRDEAETRRLLEQLAAGFSKLAALQVRNQRLQDLATTDELTSLSNARKFRHFLAAVMDASKKRKTPVTLLLFDIDDFKKYNDRFGHGVGDEILKQTAQLMRRCVREHDLVARIGGDEFAVIFWENQGPRTVRDPHAEPETPPGRPPQTPQIMCKRFQSLLSKHTFSALGPTGQGSLTISGGLATFPWDGNTPETLIAAADKALMFGAKRSGKNSIALVGEHS